MYSPSFVKLEHYLVFPSSRTLPVEPSLFSIFYDLSDLVVMFYYGSLFSLMKSTLISADGVRLHPTSIFFVYSSKSEPRFTYNARLPITTKKYNPPN